MGSKDQSQKKTKPSAKVRESELHIHSSHDDVKRRLQRASGHLNKVIAMMVENKKCVDISMQLHAVVKALIEAKKAIIYDHIEHCLTNENLSSNDLKEFKEISKYL